MNRIDIPLMAQQLNLLAEVFEKKPVSEKAALVWFDSLKEFAIEDVTGLLIGWPKTHGKFPMPAEVWRECNERAIDKRSARDAAEKAVYAAAAPFGRTPAGLAALRSMRVMLTKPKRTGRQHWDHVLSLPDSPEESRRVARECLERMSGKVVEREPGEDREEEVF